MKFSVVNLGCRVNRVESDSITQSYLARGGELVSPAYADVIVVNTCTVTGEAEKKTRKAIHRALRANEHARVLATGCAVAIDPDGYAAMDDRITIVDKSDLLELVTNQVPARVGDAFPTRVGVKIQDGCDHACTYCIVHVARGKAWSRSSAEILNEVVALEAAGAREIVLTGIDLGSYLEDGKGLSWLLRQLLDATTQCRFRISSIEPVSIDAALIDLMAQSDGRICQHLHLPLQAGSTKVLREMHRPYDADDFRDLVDQLRLAMPNISLTTDIMVAFPGETEEDFQDTLELARYCRFSKIHTFRYSRRAGTPAAARPDQISAQVSERRARELRQLSDQLHEEFGQSLVGSTQLVAIEGDGYGMADCFYKVAVDAALPVGTLVPLRLTGLTENGIFTS